MVFFLNDLINLYSIITKDCNINQFNKYIMYFYADTLKNNIYLNNKLNIIEIDITAAFPTICYMLYGRNHWFSKLIQQKENKFEKNKFIAITLTHNKSPDLIYKLTDLNIWSKIIILGYCYSIYNDIHIIELQKDGVLFIYKNLNNKFTYEQSTFLNTLSNFNFKFTKNKIYNYFRINKTSYIIYDDDNIFIKGQYKNLPKRILDIIIDLVINNKIYDQKYLENIKQLYSNFYFNILINAGLYNEIKYNYIFYNNKVISFNTSKLQILKTIYDSKNIINPIGYLSYIIYPILYLLRVSNI